LNVLARIQLDARLKSKLDPSDLVQETFMVAQKRFPEFRGADEPEVMAWLRKILANRLAYQARRYLQATKRNVSLESGLQYQIDQSSVLLADRLGTSGSSPSQRAGRRERAALLADALERLPEHYRQVIMLRNVQGLSFPDIAQHMERTLDSVKNIWPRALARLRSELGDIL
jgi:RNA polymerase sigma-70 factor (ECF subfamily)